MGANLARNAARNNARVAVFNRTAEKTASFMQAHSGEGDFIACETLADLVQILPVPRCILLMVKAGKPVDALLRGLVPLLQHGDIVIDGGNSHYRDSQLRAKRLAKTGIRFIGMGISGGEEGALRGPSLMPGCEREVYEVVRPLLERMAAPDGAGGQCVAYVGPDGAGHFVKMVHNGIEYAAMQLIAESYALLKGIGGFSNAALAKTFAAWNADEDMTSFLLEISAKIFAVKDRETGGELIDLVADRAGQKGTGKWTLQAAMEYGVAIPTINAAVDARILSGSMEKRKVHAALPADLDVQDPVPPPEKLRSIVRNALELATLCAYGQGFDLIEQASREEQWGIDISEVARIWRGGCIIRSAVLPLFAAQYGGQRQPDTYREILRRFAGEKQRDWRRAITYAAGRGIPVPALSASLAAYDAYRAKTLPQNLIQAQRDAFGAHGYERLDRPGTFHTDWLA